MGQDRVLQILLGVGRRKLRSDLSAARRDFSTFGRETSSKLRSSFKDAFSTVAGVGSVAGVAAIGKNVLDVDRKLTRLGIQAGRSKATMVAFHDTLRDLSDDTGLSTENLTDAAAKFVSLTGNFDQASAGAVVFAKTAQASGASMEDVAAAAASLSNNLGIKKIEDFEKGLSILLTQGKAGAVELRELAGLLPTIAPSFTRFGKDGAEGLAELGAALQIVRQGFGSGSEAATGLNALMTALSRNADKFEGVEFFETGADGVQRFRQFSQIIQDIGDSDLMKSPTKLTKAFGSSEAMRAFMELHKNYATKGGFLDLWQESLSSTAVKDDFAAYMESNAGRIDKAWQRLQNSIARELTPERIESLVAAFELLGRGVAWVVRNIKALVIAFGAMKLAQWGMRLYSLASALGSAGAAADKLAGASNQLGGRGLSAIAKFGRALGALGAVPGVFALGYQLGDLLAKALGLKDSLDGISDVTAKSSASEFDPDRKAQLHLNMAEDYRQRTQKIAKELERDRSLKERFKGAGRFKQLGGQKVLSDEEVADKQRQLDWLNERAVKERRSAAAVQVIERVNRAGVVKLSEAVPAIDPRMPEAARRAAASTIDPRAMQAIAAATIEQTKLQADSPELQAIMREVVAELRALNERQGQLQDDAAAAVVAWQNNVGRAPAP